MISYINKYNYLWVRRLYLLYAEFKYCQGLYLGMHQSRKESKGKAIAKAFITDLWEEDLPILLYMHILLNVGKCN